MECEKKEFSAVHQADCFSLLGYVTVEQAVIVVWKPASTQDTIRARSQQSGVADLKSAKN